MKLFGLCPLRQRFTLGRKRSHVTMAKLTSKAVYEWSRLYTMYTSCTDNNKHVQRGPLQMNVHTYARTHSLTQLRLLTITTGANKQQLCFASQPNTSHRPMQAICTTRCLSLTRSTVSDCSIQQVSNSASQNGLCVFLLKTTLMTVRRSLTHHIHPNFSTQHTLIFPPNTPFNPGKYSVRWSRRYSKHWQCG